MKLIRITLLLLLVSLIGFSQNNSYQTTIQVDGVCKMCKTRIEKACLKTKGVKFAVWNVKTHELNLIYNPKKTEMLKECFKRGAKIKSGLEMLKLQAEKSFDIWTNEKY